jgi:hypothetical protein
MVKIKNKGTRVESPIIEHIFTVKHFSIFSSFLNHIEQFLYHWTHKLEGYKCLLNLKSKGAT